MKAQNVLEAQPSATGTRPSALEREQLRPLARLIAAAIGGVDADDE